METDILIAGCGCSGLYCALHLPSDCQVTVITKADEESNDSFLAQGGMCMLTGEEDYDAYFEDTLAAGHYENDRASVEIMIRSSQDVVEDLVSWGVDFQRDEQGQLMYTREGAHSKSRIVFHEDITGKEITSHLLMEAKKRPNITILEYTTLLDIICSDGICYGAVIRRADGTLEKVAADNVVLATGGVGGVYFHSTNFRHLTGDAIAMALRHNVALKDITYVQIHPTTLYVKEKETRSFLISESMRGRGPNSTTRTATVLWMNCFPGMFSHRKFRSRCKRTARITCGKICVRFPRRNWILIFPILSSIAGRWVMMYTMNAFRWCPHSIILWVGFVWTMRVGQACPICMPLVRQRAMAFTARTVWQAIRCLRVSSLQNGQRRIWQRNPAAGMPRRNRRLWHRCPWMITGMATDWKRNIGLRSKRYSGFIE